MPRLSTSDRPPAPPPTTTEAQKAFTLIELLVVISIITLLMALLFPALQRAKRQAQAVACQANLHQWATIFQQYTSEHDGRWHRWDWPPDEPRKDWWRTLRARHEGDPNRIDQCPAQTHLEGYRRASVYALNDWIHDVRDPDGDWLFMQPYFWRNVDATRSPASVPVILDGFQLRSRPFPWDEPPACKGLPEGRGDIGHFCIIRHGSFVNGAFMDWSVRRVGLKELWTLKWHRQYDISGPWTKAGGALPKDWPPWMQQFKDY
ncbi:MAG: type II secretion system protein [Planctomycetota bacterium]|jgi:prepilin-type N-terminal cleavage/methylation domain-containing protein